MKYAADVAESEVKQWKGKAEEWSRECQVRVGDGALVGALWIGCV